MAKLILGPSGVGKSLFINKLVNEKSANSDDVIFGFELDKGASTNTFFGRITALCGTRNLAVYRILSRLLRFMRLVLHPKLCIYRSVHNKVIKKNSIVHYNILHFVTKTVDTTNADALKNEAIFQKILNEVAVFDEVIILVAPISELLSRATERTLVEKHLSFTYDRNFWINIYEKINLFQVYETLYDILEIHNIPYKVLFSSSELTERFSPCDRVFTHNALRGNYISLPKRDYVESLLEKKELHYQSVLLPYGLRNSVKDYDHIQSNREDSFEPLRTEDLRNSSILDIGSAIGNFLFKAERYGATQLCGVEPNNERFQGAVLISDLLKSKAQFLNCEFERSLFADGFDFVLCLNVIHHIRDFDSFLIDAAALTKRMLIVEFPTFLDPKFLSLVNFDPVNAENLNKLPLIGVSSLKKVDQTYVYSPYAIMQLLHDRDAGFTSTRIYPSSFAGRVIIAFIR